MGIGLVGAGCALFVAIMIWIERRKKPQAAPNDLDVTVAMLEQEDLPALLQHYQTLVTQYTDLIKTKVHNDDPVLVNLRLLIITVGKAIGCGESLEELTRESLNIKKLGNDIMLDIQERLPGQIEAAVERLAHNRRLINN